MQTTDNFDLNLVQGNDKVNPFTFENPNFEKIDEQMYNNMLGTVGTATELKSSNVHALTRDNPETAIFRFVATADYTIGDTFTVDGVSVTALMSDGTPLANKCYVINANVLCCLTGSVLTFYVASGSVEVAQNSERLGGELPAFYAKQIDMSNVSGIANAASTLAQASQTQLNGLSLWVGTQSEYDQVSVKSATTLYFITE